RTSRRCRARTPGGLCRTRREAEHVADLAALGARGSRRRVRGARTARSGAPLPRRTDGGRVSADPLTAAREMPDVRAAPVAGAHGAAQWKFAAFVVSPEPLYVGSCGQAQTGRVYGVLFVDGAPGRPGAAPGCVPISASGARPVSTQRSTAASQSTR